LVERHAAQGSVNELAGQPGQPNPTGSHGVGTADDKEAKIKKPQRVVILVHGIRTFGAWQSRLAELLAKEDPSIQFLPYFYGYLSPIFFWLPFLRVFARRRLYNWLNANQEELRGKQLTIVAHSFGTHIVAYLLKAIHRSYSVRFEHVIFCGSVVRDTFIWDEIVGPRKRVQSLFNFCGTRDVWPIVAQLFVLNTGLGGRYGFRGILGAQTGIVNLYHDVKHSGFFGDRFMIENWLPIILDRDLTPILRAARPPTPSLLTGFAVIAEPIKLALLLLPVLLPGWIVWQSHLEDLRLRKEAVDASNRAAFEESLQALTAVALTWRQAPAEAFSRLVSIDVPEGLGFMGMKLEAEILNSIVSSISSDARLPNASDPGSDQIVWSPNKRFALLILRAQGSSAASTPPPLYLFDSSNSRISKIDYPAHSGENRANPLIYGYENTDNKLFVIDGSAVDIFEANGKRSVSFSTACPTSGIVTLSLMPWLHEAIFSYDDAELCISKINKEEPPTRIRLSQGSNRVGRLSAMRGKGLLAVTLSSGDGYLLSRSENGQWSSRQIASKRPIQDISFLGDGRIVAIIGYDRTDYDELDPIGKIRCSNPTEEPVGTRFILLDDALSVASATTIQCAAYSVSGILYFFGRESGGLVLYVLKNEPDPDLAQDLRVDVFSDIPTRGMTRNHYIKYYRNDFISHLSEGSLSEAFRTRSAVIVQ
jgi:hypothetical protein